MISHQTSGDYKDYIFTQLIFASFTQLIFVSQGGGFSKAVMQVVVVLAIPREVECGGRGGQEVGIPHFPSLLPPLPASFSPPPFPHFPPSLPPTSLPKQTIPSP